MRTDNILFGIVGLLVGAIVGFMFANSVNRPVTGMSPLPGTTSGTAVPSAGNPALPPDHPPLGTSSGDAPQGAPLPQVTEAIEKAKQQPQNFEAQMTAADLYYQIQRFDEAAKLYEAANKLKPSDPEPIIKTGNAYFDGEKYEQAEGWYIKALEKDPKNIVVRTDLGLTFFLREPRDIDRAIKEYKASLAIDPDHEITLQNLTIAYDEKGDKENLRLTVEKLRSINPKNPALPKLKTQL